MFESWSRWMAFLVGFDGFFARLHLLGLPMFSFQRPLNGLETYWTHFGIFDKDALGCMRSVLTKICSLIPTSNGLLFMSCLTILVVEWAAASRSMTFCHKMSLKFSLQGWASSFTRFQVNYAPHSNIPTVSPKTGWLQVQISKNLLSTVPYGKLYWVNLQGPFMSFQSLAFGNTISAAQFSPPSVRKDNFQEAVKQESCAEMRHQGKELWLYNSCHDLL